MKNQVQLIIKTLTRRSFKNNKRRNLAAILAIIMTTMMFTTLFTLAQSLSANMTEMYLRQSGSSAHASFKSITDEQIKKIAAHPAIIHYGTSIVVGMAENEALAGSQTEIRYASDQYAKDDFALPLTGHMPEKENEIALDTFTLQRLGIPLTLGETVTLQWRRDITKPDMTSASFTLCGWWEGNASSTSHLAWVSKDFALKACDYTENPSINNICGTRMLSITFSDTEDIDGQMRKVLSDTNLNQLEFSVNLAYSAEIQQSILIENLSMYIGMILVFFAGYLIIFNIFQISITADIQFFGRLKTLGAGTKQIKKIIRGQANRLCLAGIPAGLVLGYILGILLLPVLISKEGMNTAVSASPVIFIGSALFAYITVLTSCLLPARHAGKISPMEALRYTDSDSGMKKKKKRGKKGSSVPKMAWANLWRNKKRTILVICSLTFGLVLMSYFYANNSSLDMEKYVLDLSIADFEIDDATNSSTSGYNPASQTINDKLLADINSLGKVVEEGHLYCSTTEQPLSAAAVQNYQTYYTPEILEDYASFDPQFPIWKETYDQALKGAPVTHTIYGADGLVLDAAASENYVMDGVWDAEKFASGDYALAIGPGIDQPQTGLPTYSVGETVKIEGHSFTIMAVLSPLQPMVKGSSPAFDVPLIISSDIFTAIWPENHLRKYYFNIEDSAMEDADALLTDYQQTVAPAMHIVSRQTLINQYKDEQRSSSVIGYSISVIIALVGVLNFINSMITAIISRRREFAMMQSIGMTKRQLRQMLIFEGLFYAGITLLISLILSSFTVGFLVPAMLSGGYYTFHFTLLPLFLCTPILFIFALFIPYLCFRSLEKQSVVEHLRMTE